MKKIIIISFLVLPATLLLMGLKKDSGNKYLQPEINFQKSNSAGEKVYKKYCISCHQADAGGVPHLNPPLIQTPYILGDKTRLINIILNGFNEKVEIEGEVFSNPMPPLKILKDQQIADVLTYVRNNFGNKASAITVAEVRSVRGKIK